MQESCTKRSVALEVVARKPDRTPSTEARSLVLGGEGGEGRGGKGKESVLAFGAFSAFSAFACGTICAGEHVQANFTS